MPTTEFSLFVFLVTGALPGLLDLDLVVGKLRNILGAGSGYFAGRQRTYLSFERPKRRRIQPNAAIVTETRSPKHSPQCGMLGRFDTGPHYTENSMRSP